MGFFATFLTGFVGGLLVCVVEDFTSGFWVVAFLTVDNKIVDLYGHPSDKRGVGSFCTKGITYIQEISKNPIRLKGIFFKHGEELKSIDLSHAIELLKEKLSKGKTAFLLGRQAGIEEYLLAKDL